MEAQTTGVQNIAVGSRGLPVETVVSADGTSIAYERSGDGPPLVLIGGGLNEKATFGTFSELLSEHFTVINYDRRGRGHSGDGDRNRYAIDLEVEDLAAVLAVAGGPCYVFANCTGGMIAIRGVADGLPVTKLALYEPPFAADDGTRPTVAEDYLDRLTALIDAGRYEDAVVLFEQESVGLSDENIAQFQQHPAWPALVALAPTLIYDNIIGGDGAIPLDLVAKIDIPVLVIDGGDSPPWQRHACEDLARELADARHLRMPGQSHIMNKQAATPILTEFFLS
jgi:pimeloyl-ACP methyl ester carboxylesterase